MTDDDEKNDSSIKLNTLLAEGRRLLSDGGKDPFKTHRESNRWVSRVARWLDAEFPEAGLSATWSGLPTSCLVVGGHYYNTPTAWGHFKGTIQGRLQWLGEQIEARSKATSPPDAVSATGELSNKVFVVHGRNNEAKESITRFLDKLKLNPIILHEQPNKGRTIIEKFTDYADVSFAIAILTADDKGCLATADKLKPRPRQNVILELGYFLGRLGRPRVAALYEPGVEIPSDYDGVLFIALGPGEGWRLELARELRAAGLAVDMHDAV